MAMKGIRFFYLCSLCFVFVVSVSLSLSKKIEFILPKRKTFSVSPLPILKNTSYFPVISAQGAIVVDDESNVTLFEKDADQPLLPASTTKIITALVAMDYYPQDALLKVGEIKIDGRKMNLKEGETITVENLLYGLLVYSANDAAYVLADNYPGGKEIFVKAMNEKASILGLINTKFSNPAGLDGSGHVSTARDMAHLGQIAMKNSGFAKIVGTKQIDVSSIDGRLIHKLTNVNELLGEVKGVLGVKTGWTQNARENLITYVDRDGHKVILALLGSQDRFGETKELINWIFENYEWKEVKL